MAEVKSRRRCSTTLFVAALWLACGCDPPQHQASNDVNPAASPPAEVRTMRDDVVTLLKAGFYSSDRVVEIITEEMYEPGMYDRAEVARIVEEEASRLAQEKKSWPATTDCDRLDRVFEALNRCGIVALHNAGNTQSDGYEDFRKELKTRDDKAVIAGYCFYHSQDVERSIRGEGLFLAFGPSNPDDEATKGGEIGRAICDELKQAGLAFKWNGGFDTRLLVTPFVWQRR